jgi:hypothetical protein
MADDRAWSGPEVTETSGWYFGVNFRPQVLHLRSRRTPMVFVRRTPLLTVSVDEGQYGHLNGLPMRITSRDMGGTEV